MSEINKETMNDIIKVSSSSETENFEDAVDEAGMQLDVEPEKKIKTDQEMQEEIQVEQVDEKMIEVNVFINAAPEIIQVPNKLTIAELKTEINKKFNVDFDEHRWVIGELLPADELITLEALQVSPIPISISLFRLNDNLKPECIESNVKLNDDFEVKCPYADNRYACQSILQEREIKALLGKDLYDKHLEKSLKYAALTSPESFNCRAADCDYWFLRDNDLNHFLCPKCEKTNCLTCEVIHEGRTCFEYQDDLVIANNPDEAKRRTTEQLENMIKTKKAMPCPKCGIILTKVDGCDGMKCTVCKTAICWATRGPRWGPEGQGDRSGGCKCEPYAKCHPDCHNCH
ncbi:hypothetical protein G9C98_002757 [Cotesia typhae]|uniref:RING-type domain-containing protein n=1 Tax=Cotesia typhae TaxID=2053667 RepID=A0A8J5VD21_9HYME|nr:hypothetical protein G9C98_002757 [Cotesia typhae]